MATEIYGAIECVLADHLRAVIEYVEGAARVTAEELRERFDDEKEGTVTPDPMPEPEGPEDKRFVHRLLAAEAGSRAGWG